MSQIPTRASLAVLLLAVAPGLALAQSPTDRSIQSLQLHLKMYPEDYKSYDALGAAYIQKGRETADASYYELAKQALNKSLDLLSSDPAAASAKTHMAVVMMSEHQFEDALRWAEDALALGSGDRSPWAIVGDALTDMGRYAEAEAAYAKLSSPDGDPGLAYQRDSRMAYLRFIHGDSEAATRLMRQAITTAMALHLPAENLAWSEYQLGEICFKSGDLPCAEQAYQAGLGFDPGSYRNLGGLAELRTAQERYPEAIALYQKAIAVVPFPAFAAALYDLETQCRNTAEARKQVDLIDFISKLNPVNQRLFYREVALFYADHGLKLAESLGLAEKELEVRKDIYTWDILAWVLYKDGRIAEAAEAMAKARALGTRDAILDFHAGMIEARLGHRDRASTLLASALAPNPHFHVLYADQARVTLAELRAPGSPANSGTTPASSACGGSAADRGKQGTRQP